MDLFNRIIKRNPNTILGKMITKNAEGIAMVSFIVYFLPLVILVLGTDFGNGNGTESVPFIYTFLFIWYFISFGLIGSFKGASLRSQIIDIIFSLPLYYSFIAAYLIFRIFRNKEKYPDITEQELPAYEKKLNLKRRKHKIKKIVKKTRRRKLWAM